MTGRPAATAPPNTRNSTTVTIGSPRYSKSFWSLAIVPVRALAIGSRPASSTAPPLSFCRPGAMAL